MNGEAALKVAREAFEADRPLTNEEFQAIRDGMNSEATDLVVRGGLREVGAAITRQGEARIARQRVADEQKQAAEFGRKQEEREQAWQSLDPLTAALFSAIAETRDPALKALARHYAAASGGNRGEVPNAFMPEVLHPFERARLGLE